MQRIRVIQMGLGPIGCALARRATSLPGLELVGAVDPAPDKTGREVSAILNLSPEDPAFPDLAQLQVAADLDTALANAPGGDGAVAALHSTGSFLPQVKQQFLDMIQARLHVVSTCEELSYPWLQREQVARELDAAARAAGVTLLGTGVNPGFAMDVLPITLSTAMSQVDGVRVERVVDAAGRRGPLQIKIGTGLSPAAFADQAAAGKLGHVGLRESAALVAAAWGWPLDDVEEDLQPRIAQQPVVTEHVQVQPGQVLGIHQVARGLRAGRAVVTLDLQMYLGAPDPRDELWLDGLPPLHMQIPGGIHGDLATIAVATNMLPQVVQGPTGLLTMKDLRVPTFWSGTLPG